MTNGGTDKKGNSIVRFGIGEWISIGVVIVTILGVYWQNHYDHRDFRDAIERLERASRDRWTKADDNKHMVNFAGENNLSIVSHERVPEIE